MNVDWVASIDPVQITYCRVLLTHAPPDAASTTTSFVSGVKSVCGATTIGAILWLILGGYFWDNDRYSQVTQYFLFTNPIASVSYSFIPIANASNRIHISCKINLCVTCGR